MIAIGFVGGAVLCVCYFVLRWALSLFVPARAFRSFEHAVGVAMKLVILAGVVAVVGEIVYAMNFMPK